jgi:GntR family transcriptional regulator
MWYGLIYHYGMQILIRTGDELPIYRQIMRQIVEDLSVGRLHPGDKLPSHRDLAEQLVIAPLTVKKAYDELELLGYIETQRGRGTFVCLKQPKLKLADQREQIEAAARKLLSLAYAVGLDLGDVTAILKKAESELFEGAHSVAGRSPSREEK